MKVYFVRHGQAVDDHKHIHCSLDTPLSEHGREQVAFVGQRFEAIAIDKIMASPLTRASQTAAIINQHLSVPMEENALLSERKRPSELIGLPYAARQAQEIKDQMMQHLDDPEWHFSDEENYFDLRQRIQEVRHLLESQAVENLLVVSHEVIIKLSILCMMLGSSLTATEFVRLRTFFTLDNTGISFCEFQNNKWFLQTLNDTAHLGHI